jgi:tRNA pseudouridine38-40 synthase
VAGRTDAGVHATGQVCHLDIAADRWSGLADTMVHRLAGLLPADLRVFAAGPAPAGFDARFSALFRRYEYRVADGPSGAPPLRHRDTYAWPRRLDLTALSEASRALRGEHDFAAFCRRKEHATTVRAVTELTWRRDPDGVVVATVAADAFCWSMVRSLIGALLPVGDGRKPASWPVSLLARRERANEVVVAPALGLTLVAVGYPSDPADLVRRANQTRQRRD